MSITFSIFRIKRFWVLGSGFRGSGFWVQRFRVQRFGVLGSMVLGSYLRYLVYVRWFLAG
jgi:hypothetical protein